MKGADQCPKCASTKWVQGWQEIFDLATQRSLEKGAVLPEIAVAAAAAQFNARHVRVCKNCATAWEFFEPADLLDEGVRLSSFKEPCENCAFRPGSPEQQDPAKWKELLATLDLHPETGWPRGQFFCHKGVPLDPQRTSPSDSGFAYPYKNGKFDTRKNRPCRGFLRMMRGLMDKRMRADEAEHEMQGLGHA